MRIAPQGTGHGAEPLEPLDAFISACFAQASRTESHENPHASRVGGVPSGARLRGRPEGPECLAEPLR